MRHRPLWHKQPVCHRSTITWARLTTPVIAVFAWVAGLFSAILRGTVIPLIPRRGPSCRIKFKRLAVYKTSSLRKAFASREVHKATENLPIKKAKNIRPNGDFTAMNPVVQWSNNVKKTNTENPATKNTVWHGSPTILNDGTLGHAASFVVSHRRKLGVATHLIWMKCCGWCFTNRSFPSFV